MEMSEACRRNYHTRQHVAIDDRMVASKAKVTFRANLFAGASNCLSLADSSNGYTWDFFVYEGKTDDTSGKGLSYDVVTLTNTSLLGTGYKLSVDSWCSYALRGVFLDCLNQRRLSQGHHSHHNTNFSSSAGTGLMED